MSETIAYGGVKFIRHTETYEIRKNQTGTIQYYTKIDTGESGMSVQGLANACGVAHQSLIHTIKTFTFEGAGKSDDFASNNLNCKEKKGAGKPHDFYLIKANDAHVIRDIYLELQLVEKDETIRQLEYKPIYEKTHCYTTGNIMKSTGTQ